MVFVIIITHFANRSFKTDLIPSAWKVDLVTPLLKKPGLDVDDFNNFRPISNLATVSKILERLALVQRWPNTAGSANQCPRQIRLPFRPLYGDNADQGR